MRPARCCIASSAASPSAIRLASACSKRFSETLRSVLGASDVAIELRERFLHALPRERAGRIGDGRLPQHAVGIDGDAGRIARADRATTTAAARTLGESRTRQTTSKRLLARTPSATSGH